MSKRQRPPATAPGLWIRIWRRRAGGTLMADAAYVPLLAAKLYPLDWHWPGSVVFHYGEPLSLLPGLVLTALLAPRVAYRRRDALTLLFPPRGIRLAWIIGTRLGQLPHRDWPTRTDAIPRPGRQAARIAVAVNSYRNWRRKHEPCPGDSCATRDGEPRSLPDRLLPMTGTDLPAGHPAGRAVISAGESGVPAQASLKPRDAWPLARKPGGHRRRAAARCWARIWPPS